MRYFLILFFILIFSCQSVKKTPLPFWEENSYGEFEIYYFIGNNSGKAKGFLYFGENLFSLKVLGPLNINILSMYISEKEIEINYKNNIFKEKLCPYIDIKRLLKFFNGSQEAFDPFFSCYEWDISYDGEGGSIRGIKGGEIFFIYNTTEKPFQNFSIEYFKEDISLNGKLKGIWKSF